MTAKKAIIQNVSVYYTGDFITVPVIRDNSGVWLEVKPVFYSSNKDSDELAKSIQAARAVSLSANDADYWGGNIGRVCSAAKSLFDVRWYADHSVLVVPSIKLPLRKDETTDEIVDDEWQADHSRAVELKPPDNRYVDIARVVFEMLFGKAQPG
jgi:hypothetical protein